MAANLKFKAEIYITIILFYVILLQRSYFKSKVNFMVWNQIIFMFLLLAVVSKMECRFVVHDNMTWRAESESYLSTGKSLSNR